VDSAHASCRAAVPRSGADVAQPAAAAPAAGTLRYKDAELTAVEGLEDFNGLYRTTCQQQRIRRDAPIAYVPKSNAYARLPDRPSTVRARSCRYATSSVLDGVNKVRLSPSADVCAVGRVVLATILVVLSALVDTRTVSTNVVAEPCHSRCERWRR
jgi:hypothetical protein